LVLPNSPRSALEVWLAGIPRRVGLARGWRKTLLTEAVPPRPEAVAMHKRTPPEIFQLISANPPGGRQTFPAAAHQSREYLHLAARLGADPTPLPPELVVTPAEMAAAQSKFQLPPAADRPWLGLNPGAEYGPAKRWPMHQFIAAARMVHARRPVTWLLLGGPNDAETTRLIAEALGRADVPSVNLAGRTSLRELMALLKLCRVLLTNDTGPMHVAAALGTPVVVPFGSTSPELTGPGMPGEARHRLLISNAPCAPCFLRECPVDFQCLNGIPAEQAAAAVLELLGTD